MLVLSNMVVLKLQREHSFLFVSCLDSEAFSSMPSGYFGYVFM